VTVEIRAAQRGDEAVIDDLVAELAAYERLAHAVEVTAGQIAEALFCDNPRVFCEIAEADGEVAGFAMWFYTFSTFRGRHGLFLEDLFLRPQFRGEGSAGRFSPGFPVAASGKTCAVSNGWSLTGTNWPSAFTDRTAPG